MKQITKGLTLSALLLSSLAMASTAQPGEGVKEIGRAHV